MQRISFVLLSLALVASACATPHQGRQHVRDARQQQAGVDHCPERLPPAQERIEELYRRAQSDEPAGESLEASVTGPNGETISVSVGTTTHGGSTAPSADQVKTGLSDLVLNCGGDFTDHECFVEMYLDGEKIADMGPNTQGKVAFRCLPAGEHKLRIESVGQTIFDDVVWLESDREHLAEVKETSHGDYSFEIYAVNDIAGRIPPVPSEQTQAQQSEGQTTGAHVQVETGQESHSVSAETSVQTRRETTRHEHDSTDSQTSHSSGQTGQDDYVYAMSGADFRDLLESIEDESFSDGKIRMVEAAARDNYFTSKQAKKIVEAMSFGDNQVESAVVLYPRLTDQGNFFRVLSALEYESDKEEVRDRLDL